MVLVHVHRFPNKQNHPRVIYPNETVGAVPVCPPERPRSGVSIPKTHALYAGNLTADAPLQGDTGGHTGSAPTHLHHIFPHKQNNHLRAIYPNEINRPTHNPPKRRQPPTRNLPKRNRRGGAYVPARTSAQRPIPKIHASCTGNERWMRPCRAKRAGT